MNCAIQIQPLLSGDPQKDDDWLLIQRVVFFSDHNAFADLMRRYQSGIKRMFTRFKTLDSAIIDDLTQETFIRAHLSLGSFNAQSRFSTWLYRIAFNLGVDYLRKKRIDTCSIEWVDDIPGDEEFIYWELQRDMNLAMKLLSPVQQHVVLLCFNEGYSHSEAAEKMQLPIGTIKTHIMRAKKLLEKRMKPWMVSSATLTRYQPL
jgi:RNA polymerase sigma factor (sigma-70 family)